MVGMMQIVIYLLPIYLVYKGFEIFQTAYVSVAKSRDGGIIIGILAIVLAVIIGFAAVYMSDDMAAKVSNNMQNISK